MRNYSIVLLLTVVTTHGTFAQQAGDLDSTFNADGLAITYINAGNDYGLAMAMQPDGKIVVAGMTTTNGAPLERVTLIRYLSDGSLDDMFGMGGITSTPVGTIRAQANAVAIRPDGRIIIAGYAQHVEFGSVFMLARYHPNGALDSTFGDNGIVMDNVSPMNDRANGMVLQPDGRIVVTGQAGGDFTVVRYNADGARDDSFGVDGINAIDIAGGTDEARSVALQPNGFIVAAGYSVTPELSDDRVMVVRYSPEGSLDAGFGSAGIQLSTFTNGTDLPSAVVLAGDGRIIISGTSINAGNQQVMLARYLPDGNLDASFDDDGHTVFSVGLISSLSSVVVLADGKVLAGGRSDNGLLLLRFLEDGSLDDGFGDNGVVSTSIGSNSSGAGLVVQPDGKVLLCGFAWFAPAYADVVVARYHTDSPSGMLALTERNAQLRPFPNPASEGFLLDLPLTEGSWTVRLHDATGRAVHQERMTGLAHTVDVRSLVPGSYHIVAERAGVIIHGSVVVAR